MFGCMYGNQMFSFLKFHNSEPLFSIIVKVTNRHKARLCYFNICHQAARLWRFPLLPKSKWLAWAVAWLILHLYELTAALSSSRCSPHRLCLFSGASYGVQASSPFAKRQFQQPDISEKDPGPKRQDMQQIQILKVHISKWVCRDLLGQRPFTDLFIV